MGKKTELAKNTLVLALGTFTSRFISFFLLPIYTHFLSPVQFGVVDLIITYITLLVPLIAVQLDRAAFRHLIDLRGNTQATAKVISNALRIIIGAIAVAALILLAVSVFIIKIPYVELIASTVVSALFLNLCMQFARGLGKNSSYAITGVISAALTIALVTWLVVFMRIGVEGVLIAMSVSNTLSTIYSFISLRLHKYITLKDSDPDLRRELLSFSVPLIPSAMSWWVIQAADRSIISVVMGVAATGVYAAASRYSLIFNVFNTIFDLSWTESASMHINSKDRDKFFSDVYNTSFRLFGGLGLILIAVTPFVFSIIIGEEFQAAYALIPILVIGALLRSFVSQYSVVYIAKKITKEVLVTSISAALISLMLNLTLIHWIGLYAAPVAIVVAFFVIAVWRHFDIKKYVTITITGGLFIKLTILYGIAVSLYYIDNTLLNIVNLLIAILVVMTLSREPTIAIGKKIFKKLRV